MYGKIVNCNLLSTLATVCLIISTQCSCDEYHSPKKRVICTGFAPVNSSQLHHQQALNNSTNNSNDSSSSSRSVSETERRRQFIVNITKEAWSAYERFAWGQEALQPLSQNSDRNNKLPANGETIIQSITSLWLMGLKEEYRRARNWIDEEMNITRVKLENIGSLISAYSLTGDEMFKERAKEVADYLHEQYNATGRCSNDWVGLNNFLFWKV